MITYYIMARIPEASALVREEILHLTIVRFFFKLAPHSKIQSENSTHFTWRITGETDEINFAHFTINGQIHWNYYK